VISYSTNWMGPINMQWFEERGLLKEGSVEPTTYYSAGRIDIYGVPGEHYPLEYSLAPMLGEDWNDFSDWLQGFETQELWEFEKLIACYEGASNTKIRWAEDIWYKCHECGLVTDLRESTVHIHKMDCTRKWDK
jgi:hypothetical protein